MKYSVIVPAYNESKLLEKTLISIKHAMSSTDALWELIVVNNNSTDNTSDVAKSLKTKVVFEEFNSIARARNTWALAAKNELLIFIDADTTIPPNIIDKCICTLKDSSCIAGWAKIRFDCRLWTHVSFFLYLWHFFSKALWLYSWSFVFCRKDVFETIWWFNTSLYAWEDIIFSVALRRWSKVNWKYTFLLNDHITTSSRKIKNYSMFRLTWMLLLYCFFPFLLRYKKFCWYWYKR